MWLRDKIFLFPYYLTLKIRHWLYDTGRKKSVSYDVPVICVGNVTVGGTGKTPHIEMLIRMLQDEYRIAVISRGYGRRTKGFREVSVDDDYRDVGDEPLQIKKKFPSVRVAVDADRCRTVETLMALQEDGRPTMILLDDAFQYRRIIPKINIVLVSVTRPVFEDHLLPLGRLRDLPSRMKMADIVVVTKMEGCLDSTLISSWRKKLSLSQKQSIFFTGLKYGKLVPVFASEVEPRYEYSQSTVFFTGIADDAPFREYLQRMYEIKYSISFSDHHAFSASDFKSISAISDKFYTSVVITTEKDAQRIVDRGEEIPASLKQRLFYVPIVSELIPDVGNQLDAAYDFLSKQEYERFKTEIKCRLL
ncbi:MAG: tetraacyldisaccharide 4'-kinase [Alistipes sp.]|nr:tetraacyldisaccharide 4'-kinase [Candidatus Minthomonas equi]